jgi:hypothetical protein
VKGERIELSGLIEWGYCIIAEMGVGGVCMCCSCLRGYLYSDQQKGLLRLFVYVTFYVSICMIEQWDKSRVDLYSSTAVIPNLIP